MTDLVSLILAALEEEVKEIEDYHKNNLSPLTATQVIQAHYIRDRIKKVIEENTQVVVGKTQVQVDIPDFAAWQNTLRGTNYSLMEDDLPMVVVSIYESDRWGTCYRLMRWDQSIFTCPARFCTIIKEENS